jgi:hypothetical protein
MQTLSDINIGWPICLCICIVVGCFIYSKLLNADDIPLLPYFHVTRFLSRSTTKQLVAPYDIMHLQGITVTTEISVTRDDP